MRIVSSIDIYVYMFERKNIWLLSERELLYKR